MNEPPRPVRGVPNPAPSPAQVEAEASSFQDFFSAYQRGPV